MNKSPLHIDIDSGCRSSQKYKDGILLGIDIGNNYCRIAAVQNEQLTTLVDEYGSSSIPLVLSCLNTGVAIGNAAVRRADTNWNNTIYAIV